MGMCVSVLNHVGCWLQRREAKHASSACSTVAVGCQAATPRVSWVCLRPCRRTSPRLLSCCSLVRRRCCLWGGAGVGATTPSRRGSTRHPRLLRRGRPGLRSGLTWNSRCVSVCVCVFVAESEVQRCSSAVCGCVSCGVVWCGVACCEVHGVAGCGVVDVEEGIDDVGGAVLS